MFAKRVASLGLGVTVAMMLLGLQPTQGSESASVLFLSDFESGVLNDSSSQSPSQGWSRAGNMPEITREHPRSGQFAMKAYLNKYTSHHKYRTMLQSKWLGTSDPRYSVSHNVPFFKDSWIGFSVYLPRTGMGNWSAASSNYEILAQWHDAHFSPIPEWDTEQSKNPVFSLHVSDANHPPERHWRVAFMGDSRTPYPAVGLPRPFEYESGRGFDAGSIEGDLDKWTDWVIRIRWNFWKVGSANNTPRWDKDSEYWKIPGSLENTEGSPAAGLIQVWKNGVLVVNLSPVQIGTNDNAGPVFSTGLYKGWVSQQAIDKDPVTDRLMYFDEFRYGGAGASYNDVAPAGRSVKIPEAPSSIVVR